MGTGDKQETRENLRGTLITAAEINSGTSDIEQGEVDTFPYPWEGIPRKTGHCYYRVKIESRQTTLTFEYGDTSSEGDVTLEDGDDDFGEPTGKESDTTIGPEFPVKSVYHEETVNNETTDDREQPPKEPERFLIVLAVVSAILEKGASKLGVLGFIWATVVLLGGFPSDVKLIDFWFVVIILVVQGFRIFSHSHQLRWYHQQNLNGDDDFWSSLGCKSQCGLEPLEISKVLYFIQLLASLVCATLSLLRIIKRDYISSSDATTGNSARNLQIALNIFYSLMLLEAVVSLFQKGLLDFHLSWRKRTRDLDEKFKFQYEHDSYMEHFFYYVYSKCINGHVLEGLQADMIRYAEEMLLSDMPDKQLRGATILSSFIISTEKPRRLDTMRKIGTNRVAIERLIDMLGWENKKSEEETINKETENMEMKAATIVRELRASAAIIVQVLACEIPIAHRLASIPGCMESISSLISPNGCHSDKPNLHLKHKTAVSDERNLELSVLGLGILAKIAQGDKTCGKIVTTRPDLLSKIIQFTCINKVRLTNPDENTITAIHSSVKVLKKLAENPSGEPLRAEMLKNVLMVKNLKTILQRITRTRKPLRKTTDHLLNDTIRLLEFLAIGQKEARVQIGRTGGLIDVLVDLFVNDNLNACRALFMLSLEDVNNCEMMVNNQNMIEKLLNELRKGGLFFDPKRTLNKRIIIYSANILHNIFTYCWLGHDSKKNLIKTAFEIAIQKIKIQMDEQLVESYLGLLRGILVKTRFTEIKESDVKSMITMIFELLKKYKKASIKVPNIRRYIVEMATLMMRSDNQCVEAFRSRGLEKELINISDTTSELESFYVFHGSIGLNQFRTSMHRLVKRALCQLRRNR